MNFKVKKRILGSILSLAIILTSIPAVFATETTTDENTPELVSEAVTTTDEVSDEAETTTDDAALMEVFENFTDISDHWGYDAIKSAVLAGYLNGTSETTFTPDGTATRAMGLTILYRVAGEPEFDEILMYANFGDVAQNSWYEKPFGWAAKLDIVYGAKEGLIYPETELTREEFATHLWRYAGSPTTAYNYSGVEIMSDLGDVSEISLAAIAWAHMEGIIEGYEDETLRPHNTITRTEMAIMLQRFGEKSVDYDLLSVYDVTEESVG